MTADHKRHFLNSGRSRSVILIAALTLGAFFWWRTGAAERKEAAQSKTPASVQVDTVAAKRAEVPFYASGLGTVQAFYTVTITPRVDGQLLTVGFTEGQTVKKGALLAQIDPRLYQAALEQAVAAKTKDEAQLQNAKLDLDRYELLAPQDLASKQTVDTARALVAQTDAQLKSDEAAIDNAHTQLEYTRITSPIEGRTGIRMVDPGNNVHAANNTGIVVVTQLQPISVIFTLPEEALPAISEAMARGKVTVEALSRDQHTKLDEGTLALIDNQIDQSTGTIRLKATFPNAHNNLWPGEFINARALLQTQHNALTIPSAALQRGPNGLFAYVLRSDATVEARLLKVTDENADIIAVEDGLKDGEQVVVSNQYRLQPDSKVHTSTEPAEKPTSAHSGKSKS